MPADLPAGPAIDELVATEVMGWKRLPDSVDGLVVHRLFRSPAGMETSWVPGYSTQIAHAWEVVELGRPDADGFTRWYWHLDQNALGWAASLNKRSDDREIVWEHVAHAATLPLAICRAALAAVRATAAAH